ncbi:MAG: hypothetical protein ACUVWO_14560, partial [Thermodesulfobacteriota bacterium]
EDWSGRGDLNSPLRPAHPLAGVANSRSLFVATPPSWPRYVRDQGRTKIESDERKKTGRGEEI